MKKWLLLSILCIGVAQANLLDGILFNYDFETIQNPTRDNVTAGKFYNLSLIYASYTNTSKTGQYGLSLSGNATPPYTPTANMSNASLFVGKTEWAVGGWIFLRNADADEGIIYAENILEQNNPFQGAMVSLSWTNQINYIGGPNSKRINAYWKGASESYAVSSAKFSVNETGQWVHILYQRSGATSQIYVNGALSGSSTSGSTQATGGGVFHSGFGASFGSLNGITNVTTGNPFTAGDMQPSQIIIDGWAAFDRALTTDEIAVLYNYGNGRSYSTYSLSNVTYSGNVSNNGMNYVRNLSYVINITSCYGNGTIQSVVNGINYGDVYSFNCSGGSGLANGTFVPLNEGSFQHAISFNVSVVQNQSPVVYDSQKATFVADLSNPSLTATLNAEGGFGSIHTAATNLTCTDSIANITYEVSYNATQIYNATKTSGSSQSNTFNISDGNVTAWFACSDLFGKTTTTKSVSVEIRDLSLISELTFLPTNTTQSNFTKIRLFFADNSSYWDFKVNTTPNVSFQTTNNTKLRLEITYNTGDIITRYVDVAYLPEGVIRVCANEPAQHYEQLILSSSERPALLKNVYANCYVAADTTRFTYENAKVLRAYTINSIYQLATIANGQETFLASVDGAVQVAISIDTLDFNSQTVRLDLMDDAFSFQKTGDSQITILYSNLLRDNKQVRVAILRQDTADVIFNETNFANLNNFTIVVDYTTLPNITNETLFRLVMDRVTSVGPDSYTRYFSAQGSKGVIPTQLVFMACLALLITGLTLTTSTATKGWFGMIMLTGALAISGFAVSTWYLILLQGLIVICLVFITIVGLKQNAATISP